MWLFHQVLCVCLLAVIAARAQELQNCSIDAVPLIISSTEDASTLATSILGCADGAFAVQWIGEVFIEETIHVTGGTSLDITGAGPGAIADGGSSTQLFYVDGGSSLHLSDLTLAHGGGTPHGGAVHASLSSVSFDGNVWFISNSALLSGGAIYAGFSNVSWDGDGTEFINNSAGILGGGAIRADESTLSWIGGGTHQFVNNSVTGSGGAVFAFGSTLSWDGDGAEFISNSADGYGGAVFVLEESMVSWAGNVTRFSHNSAGDDGGAISAYDSTVSWDGDRTEFSNNSAGRDGGAIYASDSTVFFDDNTTFSGNSAKESGGALVVSDLNYIGLFGGWLLNHTVFVGNNAECMGGAVYLLMCAGVSFADVTFESNSAGDCGGAVAAFTAGSEYDPTTFSRCTFSNNKADANGGAVETLAGAQQFTLCEFEGNSAGEEETETYSCGLECPRGLLQSRSTLRIPHINMPIIPSDEGDAGRTGCFAIVSR